MILLFLYSPTTTEIRNAKPRAMQLIDTMQTLRNTHRSTLVNATEVICL